MIMSRMPLRSRLLYKFMPEGNRKQLANHAEKRMRTGMQWVQTGKFPTLQAFNLKHAK